MTKFVIFAHPRSGSTSLMKVLSRSNDVKMSSEPFHPRYFEWNKGERNYSEFVINIKTLDIALSELFFKYTALKLLSYRLPKKLFKHLLSMNDLKVIFLVREDLFAASISNAIAHQQKKWHKDNYENFGIDFEPLNEEEVFSWIDYVSETNNNYEKFLRENKKGNYVKITYEDLYSDNFDDCKRNLTNLCDFLSIALPKDKDIERFMLPKNRKINYKNIYRRIPNYKNLELRYKNMIT